MADQKDEVSSYFGDEHFKYGGRDLFGDTRGTVALGAALIGLPRHRLDEGKKGYLHALMMRFVDYPDAVLFAVAAEIHELTEAGRLRQQPRYDALLAMVEAAQGMHNEVGVLIGQRSYPSQS